MRHPLERIASEYRYRHQRHHAGKGRHGRAAGSFEAFVEALVPYDDNWLTRFLAGTDYMAVGAGDRPYDPLRNAPIDAAVFDRAVGNLEDKLHAFGLCEAFTESVELIHARLGWVPAFYRPINRSEFSATLADLPQSTRDRLAERNSWDLELYARAQKLFWRTYHDVFTERTRTDASAAHERS